MRVQFNTSAIKPMYDWLTERKKNGKGEEAALRKILEHPDYQIEFQRYQEKGLPVCSISFEEAVDFFLHFDEKEFENERLQNKKETFIEFYQNMEARIQEIQMLEQISEDDLHVIKNLLKEGLPDQLLAGELDYNILFIISIGNSMGWPYRNYIDFDIAGLQMFQSKEDFLHVIAHEIHHTLFELLCPEDMKPEEYFLLNFAFEGLAVHFNNNAATKYKRAKYPGPAYSINESDWSMYREEEELLFARFRADYERAKSMTMEQIVSLVEEYEQLKYHSLKTNQDITISHYPTYYLGCHFWGLIDAVFGKERLFYVMKHPELVVDTYNKAAKTRSLPETYKL